MSIALLTIRLLLPWFVQQNMDILSSNPRKILNIMNFIAAIGLKRWATTQFLNSGHP